MGQAELETLLPFLNITPIHRTIIERLAKKPGEWVKMTSIIDDIWGDDIDGGPNDAADTLRHHIRILRPVLNAIGWDYQSTAGLRRIVPLPALAHHYV